MAIRINGDNTTAAPGITRGDDTDTGIQFGTDEVSVVTGGVERAKVDNVGRFDVNSGSSGVISAKQNTNNGGFNIYEGKDSAGSTKFYVTHNGRVGASEGVIFGTDTAAANILDDYEIGTWTPTMNSSVSSPAVTYTDREGKYVKVGDIVTCFFDVTATSISGGSGDPRITGLPFNVPNTHAGYSAIQWRSSNAFSAGSAGTILRGYAEQGAAYIVPQLDHTGTNGYGFAGNPTWGSLGRVTGYITYQTGV